MEYIQNLINLAILYAPRVLGAILVLVIGFWVVNKLVHSLDKQMKKARIDEDLRPFLKTLVSILFKVLIFFSAAGIVGIETTSFIALIAAVGFAVGLALQGSLGNFAAGILVLLFKPYRTGDFIIAQGHAGTVNEIQLFSTILFTLDNRKVIIPNGNIASGPIENLTAPGERIVDLTFGIGYGEDIDRARSVIDGVVRETPGVLLDKGYRILVKGLGDSSVNIAVKVWVRVEEYWPTYYHLNEYVKKAFDREGITIPFPQMDVHFERENIGLPTLD